MERSFSLTIDGEQRSGIIIADQDALLPSYILGGEKQPSYLWDGQTLQPWYWRTLSAVDGKRVLTFDPLAITPLSELSTTLRAQALSIVRSLAGALRACDLTFLDLSSGIIPLWRLWVTESGHILIMSQDLGDLFASVSEEEQRYLHIASWVHHTVHPPFSLIDQMASLLYYSAVGVPPFFDKNSREDGFRALPLALLDTGLDAQTASFIDSTLAMGLNRMRDAAGNMKPQLALSFFLDKSASLIWNLQSLTEPKSRDELLISADAIRFVENQAKRAKARIFWRRRGWLIIALAVASLAVGSFATARVKEALAPPYSAAYSPEEIIRAYYEGQSELDLQKMEAPLARKVKNPASLEVTNLFVTRQTRQAYEAINVQVNAQNWVEDGMPAIVEGSFIYGVSDVVITRTGERDWTVSATYWAPFNYETESAETAMGVYAYDLAQNFSIEMGKRGWYEIVAISAPEISNMRAVAVTTVPRFADTIQGPR